MREYIDRQIAFEEIRDAIQSHPSSFFNGITAARYILDRIPTADVVPVRRGRWTERGPSEYECPFCRKIIFADDERDRNYCCSCGAKMDMDVYEWLESQLKDEWLESQLKDGEQ